MGSLLAGQAAAGLRFTSSHSPPAATQRDAGSLHPMARRGVTDKVPLTLAGMKLPVPAKWVSAFLNWTVTPM